MRKKRQTPLRKLSADDRKRDAEAWLRRSGAANMVSAYAKRYGVRLDLAYQELLELGYGTRAAIAYYEARGIEWEYRFPGGEETVCPKVPESAEDVDGLFED